MVVGVAQQGQSLERAGILYMVGILDTHGTLGILHYVTLPSMPSMPTFRSGTVGILPSGE